MHFLKKEPNHLCLCVYTHPYGLVYFKKSMCVHTHIHQCNIDSICMHVCGFFLRLFGLKAPFWSDNHLIQFLMFLLSNTSSSTNVFLCCLWAQIKHRWIHLSLFHWLKKNSLASLLLYKELYVNNLLKYTLESTLVFINNPAHRHDCIWYFKIQITPNHNQILPTWLNNATIVPANKDNLCLNETTPSWTKKTD